jgi:predicted MFS family arabinose efflux permease
VPRSPDSRSRARRLLPLVFATMATQASIVVLAPLIVAIGDDLGGSVGAIGAARSVLAATAFVGSLAIGPMIDRIGVRPLIVRGAVFGFVGAAMTAAAPSLPFFYLAHAVTGLGVACLLSAGFAGVASYFSGAREMTWAMGYVVGAQSIAWIVGNPIVGTLAHEVSWRLSYAVPATVCLLALVAGLYARPAPGPVSARDEPSSIRDGLFAVFRDRSARRWATAELVGYTAWTAELTYAGAFYIHAYGVGEATVGILLAIGSLVFLGTSLNTARTTARLPRKPLVVVSAIGMGAMFVPFLNWTPSIVLTLVMFCVMAVFAGFRTTGSSSLGLDQLPDRPGAMMGARTASAQLGYTLGAAGGGAVIAIAGFGTLGFVLFTGMAFSAILFARVTDPSAGSRTPIAARPEPVID